MYKHFLKYFIFTFITINTIILSVNIVIDSDSLISGKKLDKIINELNNGNPLGDINYHHHRIFIEKFILSQSDNISTIILGSSRSAQLQEKIFKDKFGKVLNCSIPGASFGDIIAILNIILLNKKISPKNIIWSIDPWIFNKNSELNIRTRDIIGHYHNFIENSNINGAFFSNYPINKNPLLSKLLNMEYTKKNLLTLKRGTKKLFYYPDTIPGKYHVKHPDGSITYPLKETSKIQHLDFNQSTIIGESLLGLRDFDMIKNIDLFNQTILFLKKNGIKLYLILLPYHPQIYTKDLSKIKMVKDVEFFLKKKYEIYGSYNPKKFIDGLHLQKESLADIVSDFFVTPVNERL